MSAPRWARISGYLEQGFRTGAEQEVIEDLLVLQRQWGELVRQSPVPQLALVAVLLKISFISWLWF